MGTISTSCSPLLYTPICIPKLRGYSIDTGLVTKESIQTSLQNNSRLAVDWFDVMVSHQSMIKHASFNMFDDKYLPQGTKKELVLSHATLQPTFEMDPDSTVFRKQSDILDIKNQNVYHQ